MSKKRMVTDSLCRFHVNWLALIKGSRQKKIRGHVMGCIVFRLLIGVPENVASCRPANQTYFDNCSQENNELSVLF
jgi:hypothetical protein